MEIPVYKTQGIILRKADLSDIDRLLTVYTKNFGKILVRAKGVGKKESKLKAFLEPFNLGDFLLAKSKTIDVLTGAECIREFINLRSNLESLAMAFYFSELVDKLIPAPERDDKIWALIFWAMEVLNQPETDLIKTKTAFEEKLIEFLGHPSFSIRGKSSAREKLHYLQSLAGEEIKSVRFLRSLSLIS